MNRIQLQAELDDAWLEAQVGTYFDSRHVDLVLPRQPIDIYKPDGDPLLLYRPAALSLGICESSRPYLRRVGQRYSLHRGYHSGIFGYYPKPDCRLTAVSVQELDALGHCLAFTRKVDELFRTEMPEAHGRQLAVAEQTQDWYLHGTAFSTGTVNRWTRRHDARTHLHVDKGDLREGFGVISVLRSGHYTGGELIFPKFGIAVDMQEGDVLLADVHEYHANNAIAGADDWERLSVILYFLTAMSECPSPAD